MIVKFIIETHSEDDFEIINFSTDAGDQTEEDYQAMTNELDEMDVSRIIGVNPETEMINAIDPGVYEYTCTVDLATDFLNTTASRMLSDDEVAAQFDSELPFEDADIVG